MFTLEQIKAAHAKVKSGADFPAYIQELIGLGIRGYENFVADGHTVYWGSDFFEINSGAKYPVLSIADTSDKDRFKTDLKEHQQGLTDYSSFCRISAGLGVEKWVVDMNEMTCTYLDKSGNQILVETIPLL